MTTQYNVAVKVPDLSNEWKVEASLRPYTVFTDKKGNLEDTCFSREDIPYVRDVIVVKTLKQEAARVAYDVLSKIEGLIVLPITECSWEEDLERVASIGEGTGVGV